MFNSEVPKATNWATAGEGHEGMGWTQGLVTVAGGTQVGTLTSYLRVFSSIWWLWLVLQHILCRAQQMRYIEYASQTTSSLCLQNCHSQTAIGPHIFEL